MLAAGPVGLQHRCTQAWLGVNTLRPAFERASTRRVHRASAPAARKLQLDAPVLWAPATADDIAAASALGELSNAVPFSPQQEVRAFNASLQPGARRRVGEQGPAR